jgi:hypothetical protein
VAGRSKSARPLATAAASGGVSGAMAGGMRTRRSRGTPAASMRASVWALSTTFLSAKSTRAAACSSRGALQMVCTEGMRRSVVARRPAAELLGLGAKKKCTRSGARPISRRPMTRALSFMPGAKPPALAG